MIKERDTLLRLAVQKEDSGYWKRGIDLRKKILTYIKEAKRAYITDKLETHRKDSKKYWKSIELILPNARSSNIEVINDPTSGEIVNGTKAADVINEYFSNIGKNLANQLPTPTDEFWPPPANTEFIWDHIITPFDIDYYSKDFCPSKSSGIIGLSSRILIDFFLIKADIMADLFNKCLVTGIYPTSWKESIMVPIPKNKNPLHLNNLRPIPFYTSARETF